MKGLKLSGLVFFTGSSLLKTWTTREPKTAVFQKFQDCQLGVSGQERRRAQLVTTLTLLLVAFVMVTAIISGLATRHSSVDTPLDANVTGKHDLVERRQNETVELAEGVMELQDEGENWPNEEELKGPGVSVESDAVEVNGEEGESQGFNPLIVKVASQQNQLISENTNNRQGQDPEY